MRDDGCEGGALWVGLGTPSGRTEDFGNADNQSRRGFCCRFIVFLLGTGIAQNRGLGGPCAAHPVAAAGQDRGAVPLLL